MAGRRIVVVGAGITGLTVAHRLVVDHPHLDVTVLEASTVTGGKLRTTPLVGISMDVDEGADAFLVRVPWAADLCAELGLADELVAPSARRASLWLDGHLRPIPSPNVLGVPLDPTTVAPGLVPDADLERLAGAGRPDAPLPAGDLSVGRVVRACVGDAVFERLVDPLIGGVNAGRADDLSCTTMAPGLLAAARSPDGLLASLRHASRETDPTAPVFNAPAGGMGRLIGELTGRLGDRIRTGVEVTGIQRSDDGWVVCGSDGTTMGADAVVVTTPAHVAATLVAPHAPEAASALGGLRHASVVVATMAWRRADLEVPEDQSGFLVGRGEGLLMTACSFAGSKWAHLDDPDHTILRVSCGRIDDERHDALDDPGLAAALSADVATTLGVQARPVVARLTRWPRSLVQFPVGHPDLMAEVDSALAASPGLVVTGAARHGVGIPACVRSGTETAAEVADLVG